MGKFENGIWVAVQFLVCSHNETELAKQLILESGLTKQDCLKSQMESDFESETMLEFINIVFLLLMIGIVASANTMRFVRISLCIVMYCKDESHRERNHVNIIK